MINEELTGKNVYNAIKNYYRNDIEIARALRISSVAVGHWKYGRNMPSIDNIVMVSDITGIKVDDLIIRK